MVVNECNSSTASAVCWQDLPDPRDGAAPYGGRTEITLSHAVWWHIVGKHVLQDRQKPREELFSAEVLKDLRCVNKPYNLQDNAVDRAVLRLESQVRCSLKRQLVLTYAICRLDSSIEGSSQHWALVLLTDTIAFVHACGTHNRSATCYFFEMAGVESREYRWWRVVRRLVFRYGVCDRRGALRLPEERGKKSVHEKGTTGEMVTAIRFVTPSRWGFSSNQAGAVWQERLTALPAAGTPPTVLPLRADHPHRLKSWRR
jgi:hypothetical protein